LKFITNAGLFGDQSTSIESLILSMAELEREAFLLPSTHPYVSLEQPTGGSSVSQSDLSYVANGWDSIPGLPIRTDEWVEAPPAPADSGTGGTSPNNVVLAIDCEMVDTSRGKELARIAVVDFWTEELIFDELVKPAEPIVDYLTQWVQAPVHFKKLSIHTHHFTLQIFRDDSFNIRAD
jgi:RNA exonuclease